MAEEATPYFTTTKPFGITPYPVNIKSLEAEVRQMISNMALELEKWRDEKLRAHLYALCDDCGQLVPLAEARLVEDIAHLSAVEDYNNPEVKITLQQNAFKVTCQSCLDKGATPK